MNATDERAVWTTAYINDLPDSAFLFVESGGNKDSDGRTTPRTLRHFPYKDANGNVDLPHLRDALSRIPQSNLPADVKQSLTAKAQKLLAGQNEKAADDAELELRYAIAPITHVDVRDPTGTPDNTWTMSGYAAVFNQGTTLFDGRLNQVTEDIDPRAFDRVLREQPLGSPDGVVHFNYGHDMLASVAATDIPAGQPGSLQLSADAHGLRYLAKVSRDDPDAVRMAVKMRDGVLKQASFAFTIRDKQETVSDLPDGRMREHQRILEIGVLRDVCAAPQGAYSQTVSQLRTLAAAYGPPPGATLVSPDFGGETGVSLAQRGAAARPRLDADTMRRIRGHARR